MKLRNINTHHPQNPQRKNVANSISLGCRASLRVCHLADAKTKSQQASPPPQATAGPSFGRACVSPFKFKYMPVSFKASCPEYTACVTSSKNPARAWTYLLDTLSVRQNSLSASKHGAPSMSKHVVAKPRSPADRSMQPTVPVAVTFR